MRREAECGAACTLESAVADGVVGVVLGLAVCAWGAFAASAGREAVTGVLGGGAAVLADVVGGVALCAAVCI